MKIKTGLVGLSIIPLLALAAAVPVAAPAVAQQQAQFEPVMFPFTGAEGLRMPNAEALEINGSGTIEFWVSAKWGAPLDYDPAIMAYSGPSGTRFSFNISGDKSGLGVVAGEFYDGVAFDFSDGQRHHVAIMTIGNVIEIYIDGALRDVLGFSFADLPADNFTIGTVNGFSPFIGEIGQVRIWKEPIELDVLKYFALRPLETDGPNAHPDIDALTGISAFANPEMRGFVFVGEPTEPNLTLPLQPPEPTLPPPEQ